jgi:DeoR/GlpR family transcriptional regulator of sugar metabolism
MSASPTVYSAERKHQIVQLIEQQHRVSVDELAERFGVSRASIRRDLNDLSKLGLVERTYGGAVCPDSRLRLPTWQERTIAHRDEKQRIGAAAAELVQPGDTVFLDGGTTVQCMIPGLAHVAGVTVVTWALNIVNGLMPLENVSIITIGGTVDRRNLFFAGFLAHSCLTAYQISCDKFFLGASAVSFTGGVTNDDFEAIPNKRAAIEVSRDIILLVDSSKVGTTSAGVIVPAGRLSRLVTDTAAAQEEVERLGSLGVAIDLV